MGVIKDRLIEALDHLSSNGVLKTSRSDNTGSILGRIFVWQEASRHAEQQLKAAWKDALVNELIPADDDLRDGRSQETFGESKNFTISVKVSEPRKVFDRDQFIMVVAKRFKLDPSKLNAIAIECTTDSKAPLSKKVVERGELP